MPAGRAWCCSQNDAVRAVVAGAPGSLQEVGQRMRPPRHRQRISEWQTGQRLPQIGDLEALARACTPRSLPQEQWNQLWSRLRRLHTAAERAAIDDRPSDRARSTRRPPAPYRATIAEIRARTGELV